MEELNNFENFDQDLNKSNYNNLTIWNNRPTEIPKSKIKSQTLWFIFLDFIIFFFLIYFNLINLGLMIILDIIIIILFSVIMNEELKFYNIEPIGNEFFRLRLFPNTLFFFTKNEDDILYVLDYKLKNLYGVCSYKISGAPENVHANTTAVLRKFYYYNVKFSYKFEFKPRISDLEKDEFALKRMKFESLLSKITNNNNKENQITPTPINISDFKNLSFDLELNFSFKESKKIKLDLNSDIEDIRKKLKNLKKLVEGVFYSEYTHFKIDNLKGDDLIALYQPIIPSKVKRLEFNNVYSKSNLSLNKILFVLWLGILGNLILFVNLNLNLISILIILVYNLFISTYIIFELISNFAISKVLNSHQFEFLNLNDNYEYRIYNQYPNTIFILIKDLNFLIGVKNYIVSGLPSFIQYDQRDFIRVINSINPKIPVSYTIFSEPYSIFEFINNNFSNLAKDEQDFLAPPFKYKYLKNSTIYTEIRPSKVSIENANKWIGYKSGMFKTMHVIETYYIIKLNSHSSNFLNEIELINDNLEYNSRELLSIFFNSIENLKITIFESEKLNLLLFLTNQLRLSDYFIQKDHILNIPMENKELSIFIQIEHEFKNSIPSYLPFEFKVPTNLNSSIYFGKIYNTQVCKTEEKVGMMERQLFNGLSVIGTNQQILNLWLFGILISLIQNKIPFIVLDLLGVFKNLKNYCKDIVVLELGKNFSMNIFESECPNLDYESSYLDQVLEFFEFNYQLSPTQKSILFNAVYELRSSSSPQLDITRLIPIVSAQVNNYSKDELNTILSVLNRLQYDQNINAFRVGNPKLLSKLLYSENSVIIDLSNLNFKERVMAELLFLVKLNHFGTIYNNSNPIPLKLLMIYEPFEILLYDANNINYVFEKFVQLIENIKSLGFGLILNCINIVKFINYIHRLTDSFLTLKSVGIKDEQQVYNIWAIYNTDLIRSNSYLRHNKYQEKALQNLEPYWGILKRSDLNFPFVIELDTDLFNKGSGKKIYYNKPNNSNNTEFDIDFNKLESEIIEKAQKTQLEKDFNQFSIYIPQIISFFQDFQNNINLDNYDSNIGLSYNKVINIMKQNLDDSILKNVGNIEQVNEIRKQILEKCLQHEYLKIDYKSSLGKSTNTIKKFKITNKVQDALNEYQSKIQKNDTKNEGSLDSIEINEDYINNINGNNSQDRININESDNENNYSNDTKEINELELDNEFIKLYKKYQLMEDE